MNTPPIRCHFVIIKVEQKANIDEHSHRSGLTKTHCWAIRLIGPLNFSIPCLNKLLTNSQGIIKLI